MPSHDLYALSRIIRALPGAVVAYSGGADSALLAEVAHRSLARNSIAVTADSPSIPRRELEEAKNLATERGWRHLIVATAELSDERYAVNDANRCAWCKTALMDRLMPIGEEQGWPVLLGTNVDDLSDHRPGQSAAVSRGALQPMVEAGLTKRRVRALSEELGLETFDKPAAACLASRFAYGVRVTVEGLARVERAEASLHDLGYRVVRVRDLGDDVGRIEIGLEQLGDAMADHGRLIGAVTDSGFASAAVDPSGYKQGSMNRHLNLIEIGRR